MEPIRILNMFTIMNRGGAETMVMNYYRNMDRDKVQFDFLVHRQERGAYEDEIEAMGGRIYRMIPVYPQNFHAYKKMLRQFFQEHMEYRIIHSHMSELGYYAFRQAKAQGVPIRICHAHNAPIGWDLKMIMRNYFKRRMMPYITHLFICGQESGDWLFGSKKRNQFIQLNNAVDAKKFRYDPKSEEGIRDELGLNGTLVIGHVGRFNTQKNHTFLIDVFEKIAEKRNDAVLVLAGQGELEGAVREKVRRKHLEEKVLFLGVRTDMHRIMQSFDVFVFPSLFEGLPVTMVEAQAAGNLCFISDTIPGQCILTPDVHVLPLHHSAGEWAEKILLEHGKYIKTDRYDRMAASKFDIAENAKWLEEFYLHECKG